MCVYLWDVEAVWLSAAPYKETFQCVEFGKRERRTRNRLTHTDKKHTLTLHAKCPITFTQADTKYTHALAIAIVSGPEVSY